MTTATDVYALGMLLFELATGANPWGPAELPLAALVGRVLHEDVPVASQFAARQHLTPVPAKALAGDLDAIIAKAARKEPDHRYASVLSLQGDVVRSLRSEPVSARAGARWYVLGRFLKRYRVTVAATAAILIAALVAVGGIAWQGHLARRQAARADAVKAFLISVFHASDPRIAADKPRGQTTAKELLEASADRIGTQFAADADLEIELLGTVASICRELGDTDRYLALQDREMLVARSNFGELHPAVAGILLNRAGDAIANSDYATALTLLDQADDLIKRGGRDRSTMRARWWLTRGQALINDPAAQSERVVAFQRAVALYERLDPKDPLYVDALNEMGNVNSSAMDNVAAADYFRRAVTASQTVRDRNDADVQTIYGNLGLALVYQGDFDGAERAYATSAALAEHTYGKASSIYWVPAVNYAYAVHLRGQRSRSLQMFEDLMRYLPPETVASHDAAEARARYAAALAADGLPSKAIPLLELAKRQLEERPEYYFELDLLLSTLGDAYDCAGRTDDARRALESALERRVRDGPADVQGLLAARERWGRFLLTRR